jgi:hypothetical protein
VRPFLRAAARQNYYCKFEKAGKGKCHYGETCTYPHTHWEALYYVADTGKVGRGLLKVYWPTKCDAGMNPTLTSAEIEAARKQLVPKAVEAEDFIKLLRSGPGELAIEKRLMCLQL